MPNCHHERAQCPTGSMGDILEDCVACYARELYETKESERAFIDDVEAAQAWIRRLEDALETIERRTDWVHNGLSGCGCPRCVARRALQKESYIDKQKDDKAKARIKESHFEGEATDARESEGK